MGTADVGSAGMGTIVQEEFCRERHGWSEDELGYAFKSRH